MKSNYARGLTFFDDGNFNWKYECQYITPTNNPADYCYSVAFESKDGGYIDGGVIICTYWQTKNLLTISQKGKIEFYVENFQDIKAIITPMIKANKAKPYPIYESNRKVRKDKLNKINKSKN